MTKRYRLLDLFGGAGGCAMGYMQAGFLVVSVDNRPMPRNPAHRFVQADALEFAREHGHRFDAIHWSPPCQRFSAMSARWPDRREQHPDLIGPSRELSLLLGKPYIIENVTGAPLQNPIMLCGTMFGLGTREGSQLRRHRLFESNVPIFPPRSCAHNDGSPIGVYGGGQHPARRRPATIGVWGNAGGTSARDGLAHYGAEARREAMGIDWMKGKELSQSIPPAYTRWLGRQVIDWLDGRHP